MASRRNAVALRHVAFEDLGLLAPVLARQGWDVAIMEAATADLSSDRIAMSDLLIVLGGPIGVGDIDAYPFLADELAIIERRLSKGRPTLGICLGSQLMAKALGSRVYAGPAKEIGWGCLSLTGAGAASCLAPLSDAKAMVLHWHGDTFDLPQGTTRLASSPLYENQAFAHGRNALALQFHAEADPLQLEQWYVGHTAELAAAGVAVPSLRAATRRIAPGLASRAEQIFGRWLGEIG